jgi:ribosomal protein S18 acetylase RimI-like enzyme
MASQGRAARGVSEAMATATDSSTWNGLVLRTGTDGDADIAATIHAGQIGEGFLTFLGPDFLRRLYRRVARAPESFLLIVEEGTTTVGFLAGSTDVGALYRAFLWRDGPVAALACSKRILRSWRRVIETLRHGTGGAVEGAELLAMAVNPDARGRGAGTFLVQEFLSEIRRRRQNTAHVVVGAGNDIAVALYRKSGFEVVNRFELHAGTESLLMQWVSANP